MNLVSVALPIRVKATDQLYDYSLPAEMVARPGDTVEVPFGARVLPGFVMDVRDEELSLSPSGEPVIEIQAGDGAAMRRIVVKPIRRVVDAGEPPLPGEWADMVRFLRSRYLSSWGAAVQTVMPAVSRPKERVFVTFGGSDRSAPLPPSVLDYLCRHKRIDKATLATLAGVNAAMLERWLADGTLALVREVEARMREVLVRTVTLTDFCAGRPPALESLRGERQKLVLKTLYDAGGRAEWADLVAWTGVTLAVVRSLAKRGLVGITEVARDAEGGASGTEAPQTLTADQQSVWDEIQAQRIQTHPKPILLHGVTGSGKTEVYLHAIAATLASGKGAIVLLPEIALTAQMTARFRLRFGDQVAVLHSGLSEREKYQEWLRIRRSTARVVLGARSAVFAPVCDLGLIVVDEEHETTYKQDHDPRYVVREVAAWRARQTGAQALLGSATPSLEAMVRAESGRYHLLSLPVRVGDRPLPEVTVVDMRHEQSAGGQPLFSQRLVRALSDRLARGEQSILFLNRRGFATVLLCRDCGDVATCPACDISLTLHRAANERLMCHFCGHVERLPEHCPHCGSHRIRPFGAGTERVEAELLERFSGIRVIRMDVDTTSAKGSHERLLSEFGRREADVLLGTQMIAKGLDFPGVTLVGVIAADTALRVPDFRAAERTFQLLVQVAGRAGRHALPGEVVIQTFAPEHYAIQTAARQDYHAFYEMELAARRTMRYPPFTEICKFLVAHEEESVARDQAQRLHHQLATRLSGDPHIRLLPAVPSTMARLRYQYRYQVVVVYPSFKTVQPALSAAFAEASSAVPPDVLLHIDVNAFSLM